LIVIGYAAPSIIYVIESDVGIVVSSKVDLLRSSIDSHFYLEQIFSALFEVDATKKG